MIGTISNDPVDDLETFRLFADYLSGRLGGRDAVPVKVVITGGIVEAAEMLKSKQLDLFIDSSVTAMIVNALSGSRFLLRRWKKGWGQYRSVIFVTADSGISILEDLKGKTVAFEEHFSTSGFILPALEMSRYGLDLVELRNVHGDVPAGQVGYVMANDNETQVAWLERGRVAVAAMAENDFSKFAENALKPFVVIHESPFVPYHVVCHRGDLAPEVVSRVKAALLSAHETESGRTALATFERTAKFDEIPDELIRTLDGIYSFVGKLKLGQ